MFKKLKISLALALGMVFVASSSALAHVTVSPGEVLTAERQIFSVSVPNESDTAQVTGVRLVIPEGLTSVSPNVKPGWTIEVKKTGTGEEAKVTEIIWTGGSVAVGLRDDFIFKAKAPEKATELQWKAYETYSDGKVVAWDETPSDKEGNKPYSVTKIVETATNATAAIDTTPAASSASDTKVNLAIALGAIAAIIGGAALATSRK